MNNLYLSGKDKM